MNWEAIGAVGEVFGAIAVVATLLYLGRQIGQTNRIARSTVVQELQEKYESLYALIASDPDMAELVSNLKQPEYQAKSSVEEERLDNFAILVASNWFSAQVAYDEGQFDEKVFRIYCEDVEAKLQQWPAIKPYVKRAVDRFPSARSYPILKPIYPQ